MTQQLSFLVSNFADVSGVFSTVSAVTLGDVQPVSTSGVTLTTHCASVETLNLSHIINDCPINKFEGCLATLHTASDSAREWPPPISLHTLKKEHSTRFMSQTTMIKCKKTKIYDIKS